MGATTEVTIVAHDIGAIGGMERQLSELVNGLLNARYLVTVVARRCDLPSDPRLTWIRVPGPARPFPLAYPWFFVAGSLLVWRHRRGVLHTTGAVVFNRADVATVHLCHHAVRDRMKVRPTRRSTAWYRLNSRIGARLSRLAENWCYRASRLRQLVGVSTGAVREIQHYFPDLAQSTSVIPNGVDHTVFRPDRSARSKLRNEWHLSERDFVAIFVGGDWERKGLAAAIRAVGETPDCHLVVVGDGDVAQYRALAARSGAEQRVYFQGPTPAPAPSYAAADVFVLPTLYETFSIATYEAAACGLPLLVTKVSGVEDILVDGWNGWFIQRNADDIAARLSQLQGDENLRSTMAKRARESSEQFGWERMVEAYVRLYRQLNLGTRTSQRQATPA